MLAGIPTRKTLRGDRANSGRPFRKSRQRTARAFSACIRYTESVIYWYTLYTRERVRRVLAQILERRPNDQPNGTQSIAARCRGLVRGESLFLADWLSCSHIAKEPCRTLRAENSRAPERLRRARSQRHRASAKLSEARQRLTYLEKISRDYSQTKLFFLNVNDPLKHKKWINFKFFVFKTPLKLIFASPAMVQ